MSLQLFGFGFALLQYPWLDAFTPFGLDEFIHLVGWILLLCLIDWWKPSLTWLIFVCLFVCFMCFVLLPIWSKIARVWFLYVKMIHEWVLLTCMRCLFFFVFFGCWNFGEFFFIKRKRKSKTSWISTSETKFSKIFSIFLFKKNGKISPQKNTHTHTKHVWK